MIATTADAHPLAPDLERVIGWAEPAFRELRGARVYVTGGTGFVGRWLLGAFAHANARLSLGASLVALTTDPAAAMARDPALAADAAIRFHRGDVRMPVQLDGRFTHVIHGATAASAALNAARPLEMLETIVDGTRRTMSVAREAGASRVLLLSSGAVYGAQPPDVAHVDEGFRGGPDILAPGSAYAEGKRVAELDAVLRAREGGFAVTIARMFAFVGPHLPLDTHFAIGNFIRDALAGGPIALIGDGTPYRSYMYAADLAAWLWTLLVRGADGVAYNVGADDGRSLWEVAHRVASLASPEAPLAVERARAAEPDAPATRYVPSIARAREQLGLEAWTSLDDGIRRTLAFHRSRGPSR